MDSLEANFPRLFPKAPAQQKRVPIFRRHGDRGFARNEVFTAGNEVQCDQTYLDGLLLEQDAVKLLVMENPREFGLGDVEALEEDTEPFVLEAFENLKELKDEIKRLKSHPELFRDVQTRDRFIQQSNKTTKETLRLLEGHIDDFDELVRVAAMKSDAPIKSEDVVVRRPPWQTWCSRINLPATGIPQALIEFKASRPDMVLIGAQLVPHMGVLIAEHWRQQVESIIVAIAEKNPAITEQFPKRDNMLSGVKTEGDRVAVLKFPVDMPNAALMGHVLAFGPQDKIADLARFMARCRPRDITSIGMPRAVMMGIFITCEEAKKLPHLRHF